MIRRLAALSIFLITTLPAGPRINLIFTITAGTAQKIMPSPTPANRVFIQMAIGGTGVGYVMDMSAYSRGTQAVATTAGHLTAQLCAATTTAPGCSYSDAVNSGSGAIDMSTLWIDGSHSGDTVIVSFDQRN